MTAVLQIISIACLLLAIIFFVDTIRILSRPLGSKKKTWLERHFASWLEKRGF